MQTKLQSMGFTLKHAQLIGIAVVVFAVLIFTQTGLSLKGMFASADSDKPKLTYEQVRSQVLAENGNSSSLNEMNADNARQLAMLDLSDDGEVLGANSDYPSAEEIFTPEVMNEVTIKQSGTSGPVAV